MNKYPTSALGLAIIALALFLPLQIFSNTWSIVNTGSTERLESVASVGSTSVFLTVGTNGTVLRSTDSGANWASVNIGTSNNLNAVHFHSSGIGYLVGDNGYLAKSTNSGSSFQQINTSTIKSLLAVYSKSQDTLLVAGKDGFLMISVNGGSTFNTLASNTSNDLNDIWYQGNTAYIAANNGLVLQSTNGGVSWLRRATGFTENLKSVAFFDSSIGVSVGESGRIVRTVNSGTNWSSVISGTTATITDVWAIQGTSTGFATLSDGKVLKSTDKGASWTTQDTGNNSSLNSISFANLSNGIAVGNGGSAAATGAGQPPGSISISSPDANSYWVHGSNKSITWSAINIDTLVVAYSINGGSTWNQIAQLSGSTNSYNWTIPQVVSSSALVRVSQKSDPNINGISQPFQIQPFRLALNYPNGGENLSGGTDVEVRWTAENVSNINVELSRDGGGTWTTLASNINSSLGRATVRLPLLGSANCLIRVVDATNITRNDRSDAVFTITGPSVSITAPTANVSWNAGEIYNITWNFSNINFLKAEYSTDDGNTWQTITDAIRAQNRQLVWTVPNTPTSQARIRLTDTLNKTISATSQAFTINRFPLSVSIPNGGENIRGGDFYDIRWTSRFIQSLDIDYTLDNGKTWNPIASKVSANSGLFRWSVPKSISDSARVRLRNSDDSLNLDVSDEVFNISGVRITDPTDGRLVIQNTNPLYLTVRWESVGIDTLDIVMDGTGGRTVLADNISSGNSVIATFTSLASDNIKIKAMNVADTTQFDEVSFSIGVPEVTVLYPNGGEYFGVGKTEIIRFSSRFTSAVDIKYFDGSNEFTLASSYDPSSGNFAWSVPTQTTSQASIRIYNSNSGRLLDASDNVFNITNQTVELLTPNGGELFFPSERHLISWEVSNAPFLDISYIAENGSRRDTYSIADRQPVGLGGMNWITANTPAEKATFIIRDSDKPGIYDTSDGPIKLAGLKLTTFESPNQTAIEGSSQVINWIAVESGNIAIEYSIDGGTTWREIIKDYPSSIGFYNWSVPNTPTQTARLRIWQMDNSNVRSESELFSINGVSLIAPNGGEEWLIGTDEDIRWVSSSQDRVKLEYSIDGGNNWRIIVGNIEAGVGQYKWDVPEFPSQMAKVRISSVSNPNMMDESNNTFTIKGDGVVVISPNGGEQWATSTIQSIKWSSRNIDILVAEYSSDNGTTWVRIGEVIANADSLSWTLPSVSTKNYLVRLSDKQNTSISDVSDRSFSVSGGSGFDVPSDWDVITQTGINATVLIPASIYPRVAGDTIRNGDAIGFFYSRNGLRRCAGYGRWNGNNMAVSVWGDNPMTPIKDGYADKEGYYVKVWDASSGIEYLASVTFEANPLYANNTVARISKLSTDINIGIPMIGARWNLVSANNVPVNDSVSAIVQPISNSLSYLKDQEGRFYHPGLKIDDIKRWDIKQGYYVFPWRDVTLNVTGQPAVVADYSYDFIPLKWYYLGYLPQSFMPIADALSSIASLIMVKDGDGNVYYPKEGINNIGNMIPGKGYQLISSGQISGFRYPTGVNAPISQKMDVWEEGEKEYSDWQFAEPQIATGSNLVAIVRGNGISEGSQIAAFYGDIICGRARVENGKAALTIWGDDPLTEAIEGAENGENIELRLFDEEEQRFFDLKIASSVSVIGGTVQKTLPYQDNAILQVEVDKSISSVKDKGSLNIGVSPNPASEIVTLHLSEEDLYRLEDIEIYDMKGRMVINSKEAAVSVSDLPLGSYTAILKFTDGKTKEARFVKGE
ncbi:MAG: hypothetical protein Kapaf2KO_00760 [Candidatus Kapaibacteriales bacterium]